MSLFGKAVFGWGLGGGVIGFWIYGGWRVFWVVFFLVFMGMMAGVFIWGDGGGEGGMGLSWYRGGFAWVLFGYWVCFLKGSFFRVVG